MPHFTQWSRTERSAFSADPLLVGDVVIAAHNDQIAAYDLYTGADVWTPINTIDHSVASLAFAGNRLFLRSFEASFVNVHLAQDFAVTGFTGHSGDAVEEAKPSLIALDAATGHRLSAWTQAIEDASHMLDPVTHDDILIVRETNGDMTGYNTLRSGDDALWSVSVSKVLGRDKATPGPATVHDGALFCVTDGRCVAINTASGGLRWQFPDAKRAEKDALFALEAGDRLVPTLSPAADGDLVVAIGEHALYGIDARTGRRLWSQIAPDGQRLNKPVVSKHCDRIFVTTNAGEAMVLRASDGAILATIDEWGGLGAPSNLLPPALDHDTALAQARSGIKAHDDMLILASQNGHVWCLRISDTQDHEAAPTIHLQEAIDYGFGMSHAPIVANGSVVCFGIDGQICSESIGDHKVAHFDGASTLRLPQMSDATDAQNDMTLELWLRSSHGGDLISQAGDAGGAGFRVSLVTRPDGTINHAYGEGAVQFVIFDGDGKGLLFAQTAASQICDGKWHHLALRKSGNQMAIFVDSLGLDITTLIHRDLCDEGDLEHLPPPTRRQYFDLSELSQPAKIAPFGGASLPVTLGATELGAGTYTPPETFRFRGLMAEVRFWTKALSVEDIADRMAVRLTGSEKMLRACYPLVGDEDGQFRDAVSLHQIAPADIEGVVAAPSNLLLDNSLFPYLLPTEPQWPHLSDWCARGYNPPRFAPVGSDEVIVFTTDRAVYAVDAGNGTRLWSIDTSAISAPVCNLHAVYICADGLAEAYALKTGKRLWQTDLKGAASETAAQAPVLSGDTVVFCMDGQTYHMLALNSGKLQTKYDLGGQARADAIAQNGKLYLAAPDRIEALDLTKTSKKEPLTAETKTPVTVAAGSVMQASNDRILLGNGDALQAFDLRTLTPPAKMPEGQQFAWNVFSDESAISGIAAQPAQNFLVVTTLNGVHFLEYGSGREIASYPAGDMRPHAPMIENAVAYVAFAGREDQNCVRAFDGQTGADVGRYALPGAPVGRALKIDSTLYVGTDGDAHTEDRHASALHAVAFGSTFSQRFKPDQPPLQIAEVAKTLDGFAAGTELGRNALNDGNYTVEIWINAQSASGGTLMRRAAQSGSAGFELAINEDGRITMAHQGGETHGYASVATRVFDRRWHHIAAVLRNENGAQTCQFFVDGLPLPQVFNVSLPALSGDPDHVEIGQGFDGLLTEARIWSTWLHPAEIDQRKSTKLTGNEPDLLAAWSFVRTGLIDAGRFNLTKQVSDNQAMELSELDFTAPSYATLWAKSRGAGVVTKTSLDGNGAQIDEAHYETDLIARTAQGDGRADTKIEVWVREKCDIRDMASGETATLDVGQSHHFQTDSEGKISFHITSQNVAFSPVLLMRAGFMFANELLHVSPVAESSEHIVIPPPRLTAQSALIEDYADLPGEEMSLSDKSQSLYTTLNAKTATGDALANVLVDVRAQRMIKVTSKGKSRWIGPDNALRVRTNGEGAIVLIFAADDNPGIDLMSLPTLSARASFMARDARLLIDPSDCIHSALKGVTADHLLGKAELKTGAGDRALLHSMMKEDPEVAKDSAPEVAKIMRHMASMGARAQGAGADAAGMADGPVTDAVDFTEMDAPSDAIVSRISRDGQSFDTPLSPGFMATPHFALSFGDRGVLAQSFETAQELDHFIANGDFEHASANALFESAFVLSDNDPAGGLFDAIGDAWEDVKSEGREFLKDAKDVVVRTWDEAKEGVSKFYYRVEVAVRDTWGKIKRFVIKTARQAWELMKSVLDAVGVFLKDIYDFIVELFDWGDVLEARDVVKSSINHLLDGLETAAKETVPHLIDDGVRLLKRVKSEILGVEREVPMATEFKSAANKRPTGERAKFKSHSNSSKSKFLISKVNENDRPSLDPSPPRKESGEEPVHSDLNSDLDRIFSKFMGLVNGNEPLSIESLLSLVDAALDVLLDLAEEVLLSVTDMAAKMLEFMRYILSAEIEIPFVSSFYRAIAGQPLSVLDLGSLLMAVPLHVVGTIAGFKFDAKKFENVFAVHPPFPTTGTSFKTAKFENVLSVQSPVASLNASGDAEDDKVLIDKEARRELEIIFFVTTEISGLITAANVIVVGMDKAVGKVLEPLYDDNEVIGPRNMVAPETSKLTVALRIIAGLAQASSATLLMVIRANEGKLGAPPGFAHMSGLDEPVFSEDGKSLTPAGAGAFADDIYENFKYLSHFSALIGIGVKLADAIVDLVQLARRVPILNTFDAVPSFVKSKKIHELGMPLTLTILGGACAAFSLVSLTIGQLRGKPIEDNMEVLMDMFSGLAMFCSYMNSMDMIERAGVTLGVPNSTWGLVGAEVANQNIVRPGVHFLLGYGQGKL